MTVVSGSLWSFIDVVKRYIIKDLLTTIITQFSVIISKHQPYRFSLLKVDEEKTDEESRA